MKLDLNSLQRLLQYGDVVFDWARESRGRRLLVWTAALAGIALAIVARTEWLLAQSGDESRHRGMQAIFKSRESGLQLAFDRIGDCIKSRAASDDQQQWYCERAIFEYRHAFQYFPPGYVEDVVQRRAFLAMQTELAHQIRTESLQRTQAREQDHANQLRLVQELAAWAAAIAALLGWVAYRLWIWEPFKPVVRNFVRGTARRRLRQ
jgi:hypothetical protein